MNVTINGISKNLQIPDNKLNTVLADLKINPVGVVVSINGEIYHSGQFESMTVQEKDQLEIIQMMGGG